MTHTRQNNGGGEKLDLFSDSNLLLLENNPFQVLFSDRLQVADILEWAISQLGPSEVLQTSFSISEEFLRRLYFLKQKSEMTHLTLILDHKATNMTVKLWPFLVQVFDDIHLADNHSKVILIKGAKGVCSVVTSQNLTRGNRIESYAITTDAGVFTRLSAQFGNILSRKSVPISELYERRINAD